MPALLILGTLTAALILVLLIGAFRPVHRLLAAITAAALGGALITVFVGTPSDSEGGLLVFDARTSFFFILILSTGLIVTAVSFRYFRNREVHDERHHREYYLLLLLALIGAVLLTASRHFAMLFLGMEIMSVALFGLVSYPARDPGALEAGMKYLLLSGSSSALLLLGMAFAYAATGSLEFSARPAPDAADLFRAGMLLMAVGFAFKLSLVPFHMWTPEVYAGAASPVGALLATVPKAAVALAWWRLLIESGATRDDTVGAVLVVLAMTSMIVGNLLGLFQNNVKRLLAYSSVGHMGFWLAPLAAAGPLADEATGYYLTAYLLSALAAFAVVSYRSAAVPEAEAADISSYRGLFWQAPGLALAFTIAVLSLAGMPLTVGFIAKFYVFAASVGAGNWALVVAIAFSSAVGIYYYLRLVTVLYVPAAPLRMEIGAMAKGVLLLLLSFIVFYGLIPAPLMDAVRAAMGGL